MGPSGAGKSTLLHILASFDIPDTGEVNLKINSKNHSYSMMDETKFTELRNKHIGFIFQFHHLLPEFTALENVMMPALIAGDNYQNALTKAKDLIKTVGIEKQSYQKPSELSGGEQQRTAIARALINNPSIIFADEPTGNLDKNNAYSILQLLQDLRRKYSKTFIVATHSYEIAKMAERILILGDGKITEDKN